MVKLLRRGWPTKDIPTAHLPILEVTKQPRPTCKAMQVWRAVFKVSFHDWNQIKRGTIASMEVFQGKNTPLLSRWKQRLISYFIWNLLMIPKIFGKYSVKWLDKIYIFVACHITSNHCFLFSTRKLVHYLKLRRAWIIQ